jgi:type I restriction enzyme M protein
MAKKRARDNTQTTAQRLRSIVKSARDIMRKDKGLSGDLDRLPALTWIMFLKFLDDMEKHRELEAELEGVAFRPIIELPYRWRDWAAEEKSLSGDDLIAFINNDEAVRPDGQRGPGLFATLRQLDATNGDPRRQVVATVFKGTINRMINGYLLRDVVNKVDSIHFDSTEEIHTLSHFYETMLREMRDAAGDRAANFTRPAPWCSLWSKWLTPGWVNWCTTRPAARVAFWWSLSSTWSSRSTPWKNAAFCITARSSAARPNRCPTCWPR